MEERGQLTRRSFLGRAAVLGVGASASLPFLEACANSATNVVTGKASGHVTMAIPSGGFVSDANSLPNRASANEKPFLDLFYDYLLHTDLKTGQWQPGLATGWQTSADGMTWTFKLRPNVQWHKGNGTFSADDVKYTIDSITAATKTRNLTSQNILAAKVSRVEVIDPLTVAVHLTSPWPTLGDHLSNRGNLGTIMGCKKYIESVGEQTADVEIVGTGPFQYTSRVPSSQINGEVFSKYWGTPAGVAQVTLNLVPEDATRLAQLTSGEAQIVDIPRSLVASVTRSGYHRVAAAHGSTVVWFCMGGQSGPSYKPDNPFANQMVRQALNLAVNRDEIRKKIYSGDGSLGAVSMFSPALPGYDSGSWKARPFDPTQAKQLLSAAGYPNGFDMTLYSYQLTHAPELPDLAQAVATYWKSIGVRVNLKAGDIVSGPTALAAAHKLAGVCFPIKISVNTAYDVAGQFPTFFSPPVQYNQWGIGDPQIQGLVTKALNSDTPTERTATMRRVFQAEYESYATIPIISYPVAYVASSKVAAWDLEDVYGCDLNTVRLS
jgi:peptide/nickel transport system substrate-binding protein